MELPLPAVVRLVEDIASVDASVGWVVTLCAAAGWFAGFLPLMRARDIIGTRCVCVGRSGAPSGYADRDGEGYRISDHWVSADNGFAIDPSQASAAGPLYRFQSNTRVPSLILL